MDKKYGGKREKGRVKGNDWKDGQEEATAWI